MSFTGAPGLPPPPRRAGRGREASSGRGRPRFGASARAGAATPARGRRRRAAPRRRSRPGRASSPTASVNADEHERVQDDLPRRLGVAADDRQHRHLGRRVVLLDQQRERPEVRRRPEEDDQEEPERGQAEVPGRGCVADERRHRAGRAADDDVLRRRALQPAGVDEDVEEVADERERGRERR